MLICYLPRGNVTYLLLLENLIKLWTSLYIAPPTLSLPDLSNVII
jgi:hypothetical protein